MVISFIKKANKIGIDKGYNATGPLVNMPKNMLIDAKIKNKNGDFKGNTEGVLID